MEGTVGYAGKRGDTLGSAQTRKELCSLTSPGISPLDLMFASRTLPMLCETLLAQR